MDDVFIGTVLLFAGDFAPEGWLFCDGSTMQIAQYNALYSLLGTKYGGNGTATFALPDLRSRVPVGAALSPAPLSPGLTPHALGAKGGVETVTLLTSQLPPHSHNQQFANQEATSTTAGGNVLAQPAGKVASSGDDLSLSAYGPANNLVSGNPAAIGLTGGGLPVENMPPFLSMNYIICVAGLYPRRP